MSSSRSRSKAPSARIEENGTLGSRPSREIWLVIPERESPDQVALRMDLVATAQQVGYGTPRVRRARECRVQGGEETRRKYQVLIPRDAHDLYSAMHRSLLLLVTTASCYVRQDPSADPTTRRKLIRLEDYCRYKAAFGVARGPGDPRRHIEAFFDWPAENSCDGIQDPRILPLHVFDPRMVWDELHSAGQATLFSGRFGSASRRADHCMRVWQTATLGHGRDALVVSGTTLPVGFHWDVQRGRGQDRLVTSHEVWKLKSPSAYCNVYPDEYVRGLEQRGARRVWCA